MRQCRSNNRTGTERSADNIKQQKENQTVLLPFINQVYYIAATGKPRLSGASGPQDRTLYEDCITFGVIDSLQGFTHLLAWRFSCDLMGSCVHKNKFVYIHKYKVIRQPRHLQARVHITYKYGHSYMLLP